MEGVQDKTVVCRGEWETSDDFFKLVLKPAT